MSPINKQKRSKVLTAAAVILTLVYPFVIWLSRDKLEPRWLAVVLLLLVATRIPAMKLSRLVQWSAVAGLLMFLAAVWSNALLPLKLYPVLVNLVFLVVFGLSLSTPQSMIERLARITEHNLPEAAIAYTRNVTKVWCVFFALNGCAALVTALWCTQEVWALYTGIISYLLIGSLFAIEYLVRLRFKRRHQAPLP